jgi:hypothetical protein
MAALHVIQTPKLESRILRCELTDYEWAAIRPMCRTRREACLLWTM